jgi:hypothetical protein
MPRRRRAAGWLRGHLAHIVDPRLRFLIEDVERASLEGCFREIYHLASSASPRGIWPAADDDPANVRVVGLEDASCPGLIAHCLCAAFAFIIGPDPLALYTPLLGERSAVLIRVQLQIPCPGAESSPSQASAKARLPRSPASSVPRSTDPCRPVWEKPGIYRGWGRNLCRGPSSRVRAMSGRWTPTRSGRFHCRDRRTIVGCRRASGDRSCRSDIRAHAAAHDPRSNRSLGDSGMVR